MYTFVCQVLVLPNSIRKKCTFIKVQKGHRIKNAFAELRQLLLVFIRYVRTELLVFNCKKNSFGVIGFIVCLFVFNGLVMFFF